MTLLVTGAEGQLGSCFQEIGEEYPERDYRFFTHKDLDITSEKGLSHLNPLDFKGVINCAAYTQVDRAETEREKAYAVNVLGAELLARWCHEHGLFLIHISTDYVYDIAEAPIREDHSIGPVNYYGETKWLGEEAVRKNLSSHLIIRTSWLYSHRGHNFVQTMLRLGKERDSVKVVDDQKGSPTYAMDLALALDRILHRKGKDEPLPWGTYNFSNRGEATWYEFARRILKEAGRISVIPISTAEYPTPARRPSYSVLDTTLFEEAFDIEISEWEESLEKCLTRL